jgi:pimeloyl-ACP methyl ester carboxylesterase
VQPLVNEPMECIVSGIPVYYEEVGAGRPIFMLHGMGLDHRYIARDMEPLFTGRAGWRRIYPDLPGMGQTPGIGWIATHDQMLAVILDFIDKIAPGERFTITGTSYGGYLARGLVYHRNAQIDGMLLNVPVVEFESQKRILPTHRVLREDAEFLAALKPEENWLRDFIVVQSLPLLMEFRESIFSAAALGDQAFLERLNTSPAFDVDTLPEPFSAPALILTGRYDHWCGYQDAYRLLNLYPRATFAVLDQSGHALSHEQQSLFKALVSEWLGRVEVYALRHSTG